MRKRFTQEEIDLIKRLYRDMGPDYLAAKLGRSKSSITCKAFFLGVTKPIASKPRKKRSAEPGPQVTERPLQRKKYVKTDNLQNFDPEGVRKAMQAEAAASVGSVMLRIDERTWVQVPRHLATPEYAEQVRIRMQKNRKLS